MKKVLLFLVCALSVLLQEAGVAVAAEKTSSPYTGITIEQAAGRTDLYLYNVESGYWLQENNRQRGSWNTRGNLDAHGFDVAIKAIDGGYQINPKFGHNESLNSNNWYLDTGDSVTAWNFNAIEKEGVSNAYQIKSGDNWLHATPEEEGFMLICNNVEARATWQIVTHEERVNYLVQNATESNPVDATFLIKGFNLANEDSRMAAWVQETNGNSDWNRPDDGDNGYRCLQAHGFWNSTTSKYYQMVTGVPDGVYEFYCTGFYRDGDRDQCQERRSAGTETIRGFMFINDDRAPLKSILDGAQPTQGNGFGYRNEAYEYGYFPDGGDDVARTFVSNPEAYLNEPVRATVVGGNIILGIDKTEYTGGGDWVFFSRFRLRYLGAVDISEYTNALQTAISNAEAYNGQTTDVLASALASALESAKALLDSKDTEEISAGTGALVAALEAAKRVDVSVLRPTVVLAKAEGIDVAAQEEYLANGTENEVDNRLRLVRNLRKLNAIEKVDITRIECSEPAEGEFYLYNVGAGIFFSTTADWGTHIAIDNPGMLIKFVQDGENLGLPCFRLSGNGWNGLNWEEEYWDKDGVHKFHFTPVEGKEKTYYLNVYDNHDWHFVYDPADDVCDGGRRYWNSVQKRNWNVNDYKNNPYAQWKLVSPEAYKAAMYKATESSPLDVTFLIENPNFTKARVDNADNWTRGWEGVGGQMRGNNEEPWMVIEWYESSANMTQTITGLTPGLYQVSCYGFYRDGSSDNEAAKVKNGETLIQNAFLTASALTDVQVALPNVTSEAGNMPGVGETRDGVNGEFACWPWQANQYFQTGLYKVTTPTVEVGEDGTLTIGISSEYNGVLASWVVVGNFRLTSLGVFEYATVGASNYTTFVAPYDIDEMPEGVEAYACQMQADYVHLEPVNAIPAGEAVVLKNTGTYRFCPAESAVSMEAENDLLPSDGSVVGGDNIYVLAKPESAEVGFYRTNSSLNVPSGKGYLQVSNAVKAFYGFESNDATGLTELNANLNSDEVIYNLAGQRLSKQQTGINIVNGKKVLK